GCKRNRPIGGLHKGAHRPGFQIISGIARLTLSEKNVSRLKADWRERPQDLLESVAEQGVGRDRICRESLILQSARRFTYSRKPAFDLSDIVRRSGTVITGARPVSARPLDLLGRAESIGARRRGQLDCESADRAIINVSGSRFYHDGSSPGVTSSGSRNSATTRFFSPTPP